MGLVVKTQNFHNFKKQRIMPLKTKMYYPKQEENKCQADNVPNKCSGTTILTKYQEFFARPYTVGAHLRN